MRSELQKCKKTAPGLDNIEYCMIKYLSYSAVSFLLYVFNKSFKEGTFLRKWKQAVVLPFSKPGKDAQLPDNHRPIALTSCASRLLEKILNFRLMYILESKNFLSPFQYWFQKNRSSLDALVRMATGILNAFALKEHLVAEFLTYRMHMTLPHMTFYRQFTA